MSLEIMLGRLQKVKRSGHGQYMACCPAHEDRSPSLSIKDTGEGRLLINCLAGCDTLNVLNALGMDWEDVMPPKEASYQAPVKQRVYPSDALKAIQTEARIVMLAAYSILDKKDMTVGDFQRLQLAMERINEVVEMANA